jgi:hypothetical protein
MPRPSCEQKERLLSVYMEAVGTHYEIVGQLRAVRTNLSHSAPYSEKQKRRAPKFFAIGRSSSWDGHNLPQRHTLDADELRTLSVLYSPASDHVVFRLAVFGHDSQNVAERVLEFTALRSHVSPDDSTPKIPD